MAERSERALRTSLLFDVWLINHAMSTLIDEALSQPGSVATTSASTRCAAGVPQHLAHQSWTGMRPTTVSVSLKRLAAGQGEQAPNPDDGRSYLVGLNSAGEAAHAAASPLFLTAITPPEQRSEHHAARRADRPQRIDAAFRSALELDNRPYSLADDESAVRAVTSSTTEHH